MVKRIKLRASVGRQNLTRSTSMYEANYLGDIRKQLKGITDNYEQLIEEIGNYSADVLLEALEPTFALSQKYVPVDTQKLKDSGFLEIDKSSKVPRVVLGYAKAGNPHYAILVHEMVNIQHASPTRSKYLLAALEEDADNIQKRIVVGYKKMLGNV